MAFNRRIRDRAFELYQVERSYDRVAERLRTERTPGDFSPTGTINRKTIMKWAKEDGWEGKCDASARPIQIGHTDSDGHAEAVNSERDIRPNGNLSAVDIQQELLKILQDGMTRLKEVKFVDAREAIQTLPSVVKLYERLDSVISASGKLRPEQISSAMRKLIDAMYRVPELGQAMNMPGVSERFAKEVELSFGQG